uniref:Syntaxin 10 n=1 Tax=Panthera tigris altaica TaxID=74533 RepID=A0A8C9JCB0_PANTA
MSLEDPFFVVRGEVQKAVNTARGLYQRWCELLQEDAAGGRGGRGWTTNELRNGLIEWDLEDLEETIDILGGKPAAPQSSSDLLDASMAAATSRYIEEQQATQQLIMDQQNQQLEMVSGSIRVLKHMSGRVGEELDEQGVMLDAFAHEMDHTQSRMDGVLRKMAKVSHMTNDRRQWCAIVVLLGVLLLVLILLFSL